MAEAPFARPWRSERCTRKPARPRGRASCSTRSSPRRRPSTAERIKGKSDVARESTERLREALAILGEKGSPEDVEGYKQLVLAIAQAAAEAHKEGGFIGIGGKPISDEEKAALDEIRAVLDGQAG